MSNRQAKPLWSVNAKNVPKLVEKDNRVTEDAALAIFYGLVPFGRILLSKIDGNQQLASFIPKE